jgi:hypothetical protein
MRRSDPALTTEAALGQRFSAPQRPCTSEVALCGSRCEEQAFDIAQTTAPHNANGGLGRAEAAQTRPAEPPAPCDPHRAHGRDRLISAARWCSCAGLLLSVPAHSFLGNIPSAVAPACELDLRPSRVNARNRVWWSVLIGPFGAIWGPADGIIASSAGDRTLVVAYTMTI